MSLSQGFEGLEEEHRFEIGGQGSVGQQQPRGNQCHEHGLEEKSMDSGHMLKVEWTGPIDGLEMGVREREESKVTPAFFFFYLTVRILMLFTANGKNRILSILILKFC